MTTTSADGQYHRVVLSNGLRILVAPMPHTRSATVGLFFGTGSRYEAYEQAGIAHFFEHMLFKGSSRYPSAQLIAETIEGVGGILNAGTDKELTVYWAKVASAHLPKAFDLLADMVRAPLFDEDEVAREKRVVLEELNAIVDSPGDWAAVQFDALLWPDDPLGWETVGRRDTIMAFTRDDLHAYLNRACGRRNLVVSVAGDVDVDWVLKQSETELNQNGSAPPHWTRAALANGQPLVALEERPTEQCYLLLGGHGLNHSDPDRFALSLASAILGEGMSSRLFLEVRERQGLAYDVHSSISQFHDTGAVVVGAGVDPERTEAAITAILREVDRLRQEAVPESELRKIKEFVKGRLWLGLEDSRSVAGWYAAQELLRGEILTADDVVDRVEAVTSADILRVAQRVYGPNWLNLSVVGPFNNTDQFRELLRFS
ncbi:MAG: peptidase M16 [Dehalococcoidia bacterium]|nr:peptidase M16 [Dehalococcoidia bacterium]